MLSFCNTCIPKNSLRTLSKYNLCLVYLFFCIHKYQQQRNRGLWTIEKILLVDSVCFVWLYFKLRTPVEQLYSLFFQSFCLLSLFFLQQNILAIMALWRHLMDFLLTTPWGQHTSILYYTTISYTRIILSLVSKPGCYCWSITTRFTN